MREKARGLLVSLLSLALLSIAWGCSRSRTIVYPAMTPSEKARGVYHVVERKQTLWRICKAYGVSLQEVAEINDILDVTQIRVGQRIFIPGATRVLKVAPYHPPEPPGEPEPKVETFHGKYIWPVRGTVTSAFGVRNGIKHSGIDIAAPSGTPVKAAASGKVVYRGKLRGYGRLLILKHTGEHTTVYSHLRQWTVGKGVWVKQGQQIATVGDSGRSSGPHLHFEIRIRNRPRNPFFYLPKSMQAGKRPP